MFLDCFQLGQEKPDLLTFFFFFLTKRIEGLGTRMFGSQKGDNFWVMNRVLIGPFDITAVSQYLWA